MVLIVSPIFYKTKLSFSPHKSAFSDRKRAYYGLWVKTIKLSWARKAHQHHDQVVQLETMPFTCQSRLACATDETKLWLSPSAKQRQNPCSGPHPVHQDLSTRHDWPVRKPLSVCQSVWKEIRNTLPVICWVRWETRTGYWRYFADVTNRG